jgi:hypothetical protein
LGKWIGSSETKGEIQAMKVTLRIHSQLKGRIVGAVREATANTLARAVPIALDAISRVADAELKHTSGLYKEHLRDAIKVTKDGLQIELTGIGEDLEVGYEARDMKKELLQSKAAKQGKNGRYVDIPFRHMVGSQNSGVPPGIKSRVQAAVRAEQAAAKSQRRAERNPLRVTGKMAGGTNQQQRFDRKGKTRKVSVDHKTSIYSSMMRTKAGGSAQYSTIRRISANSDPQSWWHPGFRGIRALKRIEPELRATMRQMCKQELARKGMRTK